MQRRRIKVVPLSYHDRAIYWYHEEIDRRIAVVRDVLGGQQY